MIIMVETARRLVTSNFTDNPDSIRKRKIHFL